jgi:SR1 protein
MGEFFSTQALGIVVCRYCGKLIDTVDTEKVVTYYSDCKHEECNNQASRKE